MLTVSPMKVITNKVLSQDSQPPQTGMSSIGLDLKPCSHSHEKPYPGVTSAFRAADHVGPRWHAQWGQGVEGHGRDVALFAPNERVGRVC